MIEVVFLPEDDLDSGGQKAEPVGQLFDGGAFEVQLVEFLLGHRRKSMGEGVLQVHVVLVLLLVLRENVEVEVRVVERLLN